MSYVPNPTNAAEPLDSVAAGTAAAEFRALKGRVNTLAGTLASNARNKIINGKMEVAQRGTSFAAVADGVYTLDRWFNLIAGAGVVTVSQNSDVPSNNEFQSSLRSSVTTADTSIATGDYGGLGQIIEGFNVRDLIGRTFTLSFWVRSSKTGTHCIALRNAGPSLADRSYVAEYTVSAANTWEYKTVTVTGGLITAGTWNWTNGVGLRLFFAMAAGTTYQTTAGAWQTGNFVTTSNQVNCLDSNTNIFAITGVQLEVGSVATPFEHRPIGVERALCQRYFNRLVSSDANGPLFSIFMRSTTSAIGTYGFPVAMRAAPTLTATNSAAAFYPQTAADLSADTVALSGATTLVARLSLTTTAGTAGQGGIVLASAAGTFVDFSAEL